MKKLLLLSIVSLTFTACNQSSNVPADNTGKNARDQKSNTTTPLDQSETEADRTITQKIRQFLMDTSFSINAQNIKIITQNGVVTLRGPVSNAQERDTIGKKASEVQGVTRVDNQLEVVQK